MKTILSFFFTYIGRFFRRSHINMPGRFNNLFDVGVFLYKKTFGVKKNISQELCINQEGYSDYNIRYESFFEKKTYGISGICRVKNGDDFLEQVVVSHLKLCDEIIIVDNNSSDNTPTIAKDLVDKYPDRIKYYHYSFDTKLLHTKGFGKITSNSVYSFAYASNYAISLANYSWIIKVDDDNLLIKENAIKLRNLIMHSAQKVKSRYINYRGVNIMKQGEEIGVSNQYPYSGIGDHGMFQLSPYTYFLQGETNEYLLHPYKRYRFGFLFLHLKLLKKNMGRTNYTIERRKELIEWILKKGIGSIRKYVKNSNIDLENILSSNNIT